MAPRGVDSNWSGFADWHWARLEWTAAAATKAAEALAEANALGRHNFGAVETSLMALEEKVDAHDAFYKGSLRNRKVTIKNGWHWQMKG